MKYFLDTEFHEDGHTIDLISVGIVAEDGREFYAVNNDANLTRAAAINPWLIDNVFKHLPVNRWGRRFWEADDNHPAVRGRTVIAKDIINFVGAGKRPGGEPEFWAYFADYDWVVICQLFGRMIDLPEGWPMYCMDLKQVMTMMHVNRANLPPEPAGVHNALEDARWNKLAYEFLQEEADARDARLELEPLGGIRK